MRMLCVGLVGAACCSLLSQVPERARILKAGGSVVMNRVNGELAVSVRADCTVCLGACVCPRG
jgi:hypothetical protein